MRQEFDGDYVDEVLERLGTLPPDAEPRWGSMTPGKLVAHLAGAVRYSMGRSGRIELAAPWVLTHLVGPCLLRPIYLNGWLPMPKNVKGFDAQAEPADLETLHAVLEDYLALVQTGALDPPPHPIFGAIGVDGWAKLHVVHFEHHLRQFGV